MSALKVTLPGFTVPTHGLQVSFEAPCSCEGIKSIIIDDVNYTLVDSMGNAVSAYNNSAWCSGAIVSVMLDTINNRAFVLNASIREFIESYVNSRHFGFNVVLPASGWSSSAPYTQLVSTSGISPFEITADDKPHYGLVQSDNTEERLLQKESYSFIDDLDTGVNMLMFTCLEERPTVDLAIQLEVHR